MTSTKKIQWNEIYNIGHDKIDSEHQKLFLLGAKVMNAKGNKDEIMKAVKDLIKYTKFHFANEEQYMKSINFIYLEEHKALHRNITKKLDTVLKNINNMTQEDIVNTLYNFISKNIVNHILTQDKKIHHFKKSHKELKELFQWKDTYKINHEQIDKEHQKLFEIALKTFDYKNRNAKTHIRNTLSEFHRCMKLCFEHKEVYMKEINYENFNEHKSMQDKITHLLHEFIDQLPKLSIEEIERKLIEYIDIQLLNHIIVEDKKIALSAPSPTSSRIQYKV